MLVGILKKLVGIMIGPVGILKNACRYFETVGIMNVGIMNVGIMNATLQLLHIRVPSVPSVQRRGEQNYASMQGISLYILHEEVLHRITIIRHYASQIAHSREHGCFVIDYYCGM